MENKFKLNIQRFAESENEEVVEEDSKELSFDEILEDEKYKSEFDKRITKATETAIKKAKSKWEEEVQTKQAESEKLAQMDENQKKSYEYEKVSKERDSAVSELNAYKLKDEAIKQAREKGVDSSLMETLDYMKETAESINVKIDIFSNASKKIYENAINEYSKEPTPQVGERRNSVKSLEDCKSYEDFKEYYEKHPEEN